jgi:glutamate/tyrosine decarboxylase-like PLP-dependent enzyme
MEFIVEKSKIFEIILKMIEKEIDSFSDFDNSIELYDESEKCLIKYQIITKELYFDHSLRNYILGFMNFIPHHTVHDAMKVFFNSHFPDKEVKRVIAANIVKF